MESAERKSQTPDISESKEDIDISTASFTVEEVKQAIKKLKSGKAPGEDEVCEEMVKAVDDDTARHLCQILQNIWETATRGLENRPYCTTAKEV